MFYLCQIINSRLQFNVNYLFQSHFKAISLSRALFSALYEKAANICSGVKSLVFDPILSLPTCGGIEVKFIKARLKIITHTFT